MKQFITVLNAGAIEPDKVNLVNIRHAIDEEKLSRIVVEVQQTLSRAVKMSLSGGGCLEIHARDIEVKVIELIAMSNERVNDRLEAHGHERITIPID